MSTGKRLAKRSILGTRVSAPFDGHYYSGIIQAIKNANPMDNSHEQVLYSVLFDNKINNRKVVLDFMAQDLIGPGFQTISNVALNKGQKVFITYNGREVAGCVDYHNVATDEVFLSVDLSVGSPTGKDQNQPNSQMQVRRRLDECRLSESRKSARLLELDTDYSKLAQDGFRGRTSSLSSTVSSSSVASSYIDVPLTQNGRKRRSSTGNDDVLDDCMAAMVLMSLSCSPQSSLSSQSSTETRIIFQCTWPGCGHQSLTCHQIEQHVRTKHLGRTDLNDEQLDDREEEFYYTEIEVNASPLPSSGPNSSSSSPGPQSPSDSTDGSCKSESQSPIPSPHNFFPSSAPVWSHLEDHEYLKHPEPVHAKGSPPSHYQNQGQIKIKFIHQDINSNNSLLTRPINIPGLAAHSPLGGHPYARSAPVSLGSPRAHHKYMRVNGNTKAVALTASPVQKQSPTKRVRGESRKCRKVYGMDNRDAWCTQCKWKKACTRFTD